MSSIETIIQKEKNRNPNLLRKITNFSSKYIDYKMGLIGSGIMGSIVFGINYYDTHEFIVASTAALKQGSCTFLFGGSIMRGCEYLATKIKKQAVALAAAVIIPSAVSIGLIYGVHSIKYASKYIETSRPVESTIPTAVLLIPSTAIWGYRKRKQYTNLNKLLESFD